MLDLECERGDCVSDDPFDLDRFVEAQEGTYATALVETPRRQAGPLAVVRLSAAQGTRKQPDGREVRHRLARGGSRLPGASGARSAPSGVGIGEPGDRQISSEFQCIRLRAFFGQVGIPFFVATLII